VPPIPTAYVRRPWYCWLPMSWRSRPGCSLWCSSARRRHGRKRERRGNSLQQPRPP